MREIGTLVSVGVLVGCSYGCTSAEGDADNICAIATELQADSSITPAARGEVMDERVEALSMTRVSQLGWAAVRFEDPERRYRLMRVTFEDQGVAGFSCAPLRELLEQSDLPLPPEPAPPPE